MSLKKVYYFTEKIFKTQGLGGYYELVCTRLLEGDARINSYYKEYQTKGHIFNINYDYYKPVTYDMDFKKQQLENFIKCDRPGISKITIKEAPKE